MFYAGGTFAYMSGDDPDTADKAEGGLSGGLDWKPCLIMFNNERTYWAGSLDGLQCLGEWCCHDQRLLLPGSRRCPSDRQTGYRLAVSYANADKKPSAAWLFNDYGYEVDLTATYKITNNLSYMLGGGYLFTGKYFKGTSDANQTSK